MADQRDRLALRVIANAATKPLNVLVLAGMIAASVVFGAWWIVAAAVPVYGLLVAATVKDPREAARLAGAQERRQLGTRRRLDGITGDLRTRVIAVVREEQLVSQELAQPGALAPDGLLDEIAGLVDEVLASARQASQIELYLQTVDVDDLRRRSAEYSRMAEASDKAKSTASALAEQLQVIEHLKERRDASDLEIDDVQAGLGALRAQLVRARATAVLPTGVTETVDGLRTRMRVLSDSLAEAYGEHGETPAEGKGA